VSLKPILWPHELTPQVSQLHDVLNDEQDLACALIGGAFVDHCLGALLQQYLVKGKVALGLLQPGQTLGDFGSRRQMSYTLGLISEPYEPLTGLLADTTLDRA